MNLKHKGNEKVISAILFLGSWLYLIFSLKLKIGTHKIMGPGFFPIFIGVLLIVCIGAHLMRLFKEKPEGEAAQATPFWKGRNYLAVIGILACTTAYPFVLGYLKFIVSTFLAGFAMLMFLKPKSIIFSCFLSLAMAVGFFLLFSRLFGVALPSGPIEDLLYRIGG
jgi:hypothetical protein